MIVIVLLQLSAFAFPQEAVKWSELGQHLAEKSVATEALPVIDCPAGIDTESAEHLVCQIIENTFYKWKEYEFCDVDGKVRLAIEMIKPEARMLKAAEAQILLQGSKLGERQISVSAAVMTTRPAPLVPLRVTRPVFKRLSSFEVELPLERSVDINLSSKRPDSDITLGDSLPLLRESIQGNDDRVRVAANADITKYPWNTICFLDFLVAGDGYRGSGILVASNCVLTCGHNLWDQELNVGSTSMKVTPAQFQDYQGGAIYEPFGTVFSSDLVSNTIYMDRSGGSEYDYGAVLLPQSFPGISTYMPIEYDSTPSVINLAGYPGEVQNETNSYDMWYDYDEVLGYEGSNDRVLLHQADTSGGQSGSPVWRFDETTQSYRLVAIHVFGALRGNGACRLVSAIEPIISKWMAYESVDSVAYTDFSYIPYFSTTSSCWTGLALANYNAIANRVKIDYYGADGNHLGSEQKNIAAYGQAVFPTATANGTEGWIKVSSTGSLKGLALIGASDSATMYDIDLKESLHRKFLFPHLAADQNWRSFALLCNPNDVATRLSFKYYNSSGTLEYTRSVPPIPANGSVKYPVSTIFQETMTGGTMVLESDQPVTAFLLYDNKATTWKAGLSAVPLD